MTSSQIVPINLIHIITSKERQMKVGSLVECVKDAIGFNPNFVERPVIGGVYIVRAFVDRVALLLEEIHNPPDPNGKEYGFYIERFRELQLPMDISELVEECQAVSIEI